jgi:hypothetical protein
LIDLDIDWSKSWIAELVNATVLSEPIAFTSYVSEMKQAGLQIKSDIFNSMQVEFEEMKTPAQTTHQ